MTFNVSEFPLIEFIPDAVTAFRRMRDMKRCVQGADVSFSHASVVQYSYLSSPAVQPSYVSEISNVEASPHFSLPRLALLAPVFTTTSVRSQPTSHAQNRRAMCCSPPSSHPPLLPNCGILYSAFPITTTVVARRSSSVQRWDENLHT